VEQDKEEEDGFAHKVGKRPRNELLFGSTLQKMETGSDFDRSRLIAALGTRQRDKRFHRRAGNKNPERCPPND
jgi:hypothetical protein